MKKKNTTEEENTRAKLYWYGTEFGRKRNYKQKIPGSSQSKDGTLFCERQSKKYHTRKSYQSNTLLIWNWVWHKKMTKDKEYQAEISQNMRLNFVNETENRIPQTNKWPEQKSNHMELSLKQKKYQRKKYSQ